MRTTTFEMFAEKEQMREFVQTYEVRKYEIKREYTPPVVSLGKGAVFLYKVTMRHPSGFKMPHIVGYRLLDKLIMGFQKNNRFEYMMLDRLRSDCDYYLGHGGRCAKSLWAGDEQEQIKEMRRLYNILPFKPQWCTVEKIGEYARKMNIYG